MKDVPGKYPHACVVFSCVALVLGCITEHPHDGPFIIFLHSVTTILAIFITELHRKGFEQHHIVLNAVTTVLGFLFGCLIGEHSNNSVGANVFVSLAVTCFFISAAGVHASLMRNSRILPAETASASHEETSV